ncbi:hypothetical protein Glove_137g13 [Diversispora epigaea]|uniref:Uncharacterized protein n=1 Tax=Diversispora epigaea TaxID=1348612 RepID=A0A397IZ29_9GLOM|nr:hypothetical protein Glove_137g13 [Diversispora epigaea]
MNKYLITSLSFSSSTINGIVGSVPGLVHLDMLDVLGVVNTGNLAMAKTNVLLLQREISDIQKLLASSGIKSDYTIENEFINKFVWEIANFTIDKKIYPDGNYLKSAANNYAKLEFHEYFKD